MNNTPLTSVVFCTMYAIVNGLMKKSATLAPENSKPVTTTVASADTIAAG